LTAGSFNIISLAISSVPASKTAIPNFALSSGPASIRIFSSSRFFKVNKMLDYNLVIYFGCCFVKIFFNGLNNIYEMKLIVFQISDELNYNSNDDNSY